MDYKKHYDALIDRARSRVLECYVERHHVVPRCLGGGNESSNIVELTAEEHYVAHQLIVKMYPGHVGLAWAAVKMAKQCSGNKAYGWLRRKYAANKRGRTVSQETRKKISSGHIGKKKTEETKLRMSIAQKGHKAPKGWTHSAAARAKIAAAHIGNKYNLGRVCSQETRRKIAASMKGKNSRPMTEEVKAKISAANRGQKRSIESREKMSAWQRGRIMSPESRLKMSISRRAYFDRLRAQA